MHIANIPKANLQEAKSFRKKLGTNGPTDGPTDRGTDQWTNRPTKPHIDPPWGG